MGVFPSGQWGQTVNLLLSASVVRIHPRPPKNLSVCKCAEVFVLLVRETHKCGWIRTASTRRTVRRVKKPLCNSDDRCQRQNQGGAVGAAASRMRVPPKARCSRWEPRPGLLFCAARAIHPRPPRTPISEPGTGVSVLSAMQKGCKGRFEQYRFILSPTDIASAPDLWYHTGNQNDTDGGLFP